MVHLLRKASLPDPSEVGERLIAAATLAPSVKLREPRPAGFPLLFSAQWQLIEPATAFLHEHLVQRAHTADTIRTYTEILYDWFETLEQNGIRWDDAVAVDLVAYRNRMLQQPSAHTGRPYRVSTINHRVRGVLRFYEWAVRTRWLSSSALIDTPRNVGVARQPRLVGTDTAKAIERSFFVLRQFEPLPRPLMSEQARELMAALPAPYDLMARWQLYTGLRVSELLRLTLADVVRPQQPVIPYQMIEVLRKGRKIGHVIASASLLDETAGYMCGHRHAWLLRSRSRRGGGEHTALFINARGAPAGKNAYQRVVSATGLRCGFKATTHLLRSTFACMLLARLERLASEGAAVNPLLVVKVLLGHERIETTDRYLRAIVVDVVLLKEVLDTLLSRER